MTRQYVQRTEKSPQKDDNWILQRTAVRQLPGKAKTPQVPRESLAEDKPPIKQDLMQIPVSSDDRPVVGPRLMVGKAGEISNQYRRQGNISDADGQLLQRQPRFGGLSHELTDRSLRRPVPQIQAKLTIGQPDDKYEQEADRVASQVVQQINAPASTQSTPGQSVQRQSETEEEQKQAIPDITSLQGREEPTRKVQTKLTLQGADAIASGEASSDLTSAINSARGGGQPLDAGLQQSMGQAMRADFSGVRVHTDARSDQLNQSIQAKAFTTGQDVFFRQGEYHPGTRGGQETIAHELTHVVQQNGGAVMRSQEPPQEKQLHPAAGIPSASRGDRAIQKVSVDPATEFKGARAHNDIKANIKGNEMTGFGTQVKGKLWHTKLTFKPLKKPGSVSPFKQMNPEGTGVTGIIGPDHPYGTQPDSKTAEENNKIAGDIRGYSPHGHVAAHIVNDQLGGPGIDQNLFALPGPANTLMEKKVEGKMKAAVAAGSYIYYSADVHHPAKGPADYIEMSWNKLDEDGNDIGGGQQNVKIKADNKSENESDVRQTSMNEAKSTLLINPKDAQTIKNQPQGPFQMPDPKKLSEQGHYLDTTAFPVVGNYIAFKEFFKNNKQNKSNLDQLFRDIDDASIYKNIEKGIRGLRINIKKGAGRGITENDMSDLKGGGSAAKEAIKKIIGTGEADKVIPIVAKEYTKLARAKAKARL